MAPSISVAEYYANKTIFITGATGFLGKVLVEKLLRTCPDITRIYALMRAKKGHSSKDRADNYFNVKIFDQLKKDHPSRLQKLHVVPGDILLEGLGMSPEDRAALQSEVQVIFHCAACVRFDMPLRDAVKMNTVGTLKMLELAEGMQRLEVFEHVSTTFTRSYNEVLEERLYPAKHRPQNLIDSTSWMDDELLQCLESKIIEPLPNTYAYTKNLTEDLVSQYQGKFPIAIARPSIVTAAVKEPLPGWIDNVTGPTAILMGCGKGVIRSIHTDEKYMSELVPVDIVVNGCIILAKITGIEKPEEIQFCNISQSDVNSISWGNVFNLGRIHIKEFPFSECLWYPDGGLRSSRLHHQMATLFLQIIPAYFIDLLLFLLGKKTFMRKLQKRIISGLKIFEYYTSKEWHFKNDNFLMLKASLSRKDNQTFYTDFNMITWSDYARNYIKGVREYICNEDPSTLPQARTLHKRLFYLDRLVKVLFFGFIAYFFINITRVPSILTATRINV